MSEQMSGEYRAGWRAACAKLHDLYAGFAAEYARDTKRQLQSSLYSRAAEMAIWEAEKPQLGMVAVPAGETTPEEPRDA